MEVSSCTILVSSVLAAALAVMTSPLWLPIFLKIKLDIRDVDLFPDVQVQWRPTLALASVVLFVALLIKEQATKVAIVPCTHPKVVACR